MLLLEFLCRKLESDGIRDLPDQTYLVGVWVNHTAECTAYDLAAKELWAAGFVILRVRGVMHWKQRSPSSSKLLGELWNRAERTGFSILVAETSVRFSGSKIRGTTKKKVDVWRDEVPTNREESLTIKR